MREKEEIESEKWTREKDDEKEKREEKEVS